MSDTYQFGLPLVQAAQAQKHVTVNEALTRLDAVAQMRVKADDWEIPSANPVESQQPSMPIISRIFLGPNGSFVPQVAVGDMKLNVSFAGIA